MNRLTLSLFCLLMILPSVRAEAPPILVCDMKKVAEECDEAVELVETLKKRTQGKRDEVQLEVAALQAKQKELLGKTLSERDDKWYAEYGAAVQTENELKSKASVFNARMQDDIARKIEQLMIGTRQEAMKVMKERGASLVLNSLMGKMKFENDEELKEEYVFRRVVCCDPALDITGEVLARMNKWWKEHRPASGEPPKREDGAAKGESKAGSKGEKDGDKGEAKGEKDDAGKPVKGG